MRCVIWSENKEPFASFKADLAETCEFNVVSDLGELQEVLGRGDVKTVFINFDLASENWSGISSGLKLQMPEIKWVLFSDSADGSSELTGHQRGENPADGYLVGPLTSEMVEDYFEDIVLVEETLSGLNIDESNENMDLDFGSGSVEIEENETGANIQEKFDDIIDSPDELSFQLDEKSTSDEMDLDVSDDDALEINFGTETSDDNLDDQTLMKPIDMGQIADQSKPDNSFSDDALLSLDNQKDSEFNLGAENLEEATLEDRTSSMSSGSFTLDEIDPTLTETSLDHRENSMTDANELSMINIQSKPEFNISEDESLTSINVLKENFKPHLPSSLEAVPETAVEDSDYWNKEDSQNLSETLAEIKNDRSRLLVEIEDLKKENTSLRRKDIGYRTEIEDLKVELELMRNRAISQNQDLKFQLQLLEDKKSLLEQKAKDYQEQYQQMSEKSKIDHNQVRENEVQLQGKLELLKADSKAQIENRENVIIELKRKIDNLEFNIETISIKEDRSKQDRVQVEQKMNKVMSSLRFCLDVLESDEGSTDRLKVLNKLKNIG